MMAVDNLPDLKPQKEELPWEPWEVERELCNRSLWEFVKHAWPIIEPDKFVEGWHIKAVCEHLEAVSRKQIRNLVINVPPRHTKSLVTSVLWPAWEWGPFNRPQTRWLCMSYASDLSVRDSVKCRVLMQSKWYRERWGSKFVLQGDQNAKERYNNVRGGYRFASSVGGVGTGEGGDRLCVSAQTIVETDAGKFPISEVVAGKGKQVASYNHKFGKVEFRSIQERMRNPGRQLVEVALEGGRTLQCTCDHPVFTTNRGYVAAGSLTAEDLVLVE